MDDAPVGGQWSAPAGRGQGHGQWMYNPGWGMDNLYLYIKGWLYVQGYWDWGVVLNWHVQRNMYTDPGSLFWVCVLWRKDENDAWVLQLQKMEAIPKHDMHKYQHWMIHEPGGPPHAYKILYLLNSIYCIIYVLLCCG